MELLQSVFINVFTDLAICIYIYARKISKVDEMFGNLSLFLKFYAVITSPTVKNTPNFPMRMC